MAYNGVSSFPLVAGPPSSPHQFAATHPTPSGLSVAASHYQSHQYSAGLIRSQSSVRLILCSISVYSLIRGENSSTGLAILLLMTFHSPQPALVSLSKTRIYPLPIQPCPPATLHPRTTDKFKVREAIGVHQSPERPGVYATKTASGNQT